MRHLGWLSRSTASGPLNTIFSLQLNKSKYEILKVNIKKRNIQVQVPVASNLTQC
jgi:hypothetical protein